MFPKGSPLFPFFNNAYNILRQTGALTRIKEKWTDNKLKCNSNPLKPITFYKIGSLVALLIFGVGCAIVIVVLESMWMTSRGQRNLEGFHRRLT